MKKGTVFQVSEGLLQLADDSHSYPFRIKHSSIYVVPDSIKDLNRSLYTPQTVSFGPYHHGKDHLMPMEVHKQRALHRFLRRTGQPIESIVQSLTEVLEALRDSYNSLDESWNEDVNFLKLMILDGCFMLEIIYLMNRFQYQSEDHYDANDPVFSNHGKLHTGPYIRRDLLVLENQLPMLLLLKLHSFWRREYETDLPLLMIRFWPLNWRYSGDSLNCLHVLDLHRKILLHGSPDTRATYPVKRQTDTIPSAVGLRQAGISFRQSNTTSVKNIRFKRSVLEVPLLLVDEDFELLFLNLMAFERLHVGAGNEIISYVFFMSAIINTESDVALLRSKGIIQNAMGSDKAVARMFNSVSKDVVLDPESSLTVTYAKINHHWRKPWNKWRAGIIQTVNYFQSTWAFLTLIAATVYFALTVAQTVYTVLSFYKS